MNQSDPIQVAISHHQAGRLAEAEAIYRQLLARIPDHADALHLLGTLACQTGALDVAIDLIGRAIAVCPGQAAYHLNLGESYRRAGRPGEAIVSFRRALELRPAHAATYNNLGLALSEAGRIDEAIGAYRAAIAHDAGHAWAHVNLGNALAQQGKHAEALAATQRAIALAPNFTEAHNSLGVALQALGRTDEAIAAYRQVIALQPKEAWAYVNLANALNDQGKHAEAVAACERAIALRPDFAAAYNSLGVFLQAQNRPDDAAEAYQRALALNPGLVEALGNLGTAFEDQGRLDDARECYNKLLALRPDSPRVVSHLLMALHLRPEYDAQAILAEHRRWASRYAEPLACVVRVHANDPTPERRLRVGFVSPDFRTHPIGQLVGPLFAHHDPRQTEFIGYSDVRAPDAVTARLKGMTDAWCDTAGLSDAELAEQIRADRIDILIDLALHSAGNRMLVFARKPAPVQVTMLGLPTTTGLSTIDYRLTDPYLDPPGASDADYSEQSIRLPHCYWCYEPAPGTPPVGPLPARANDFVTFGCLNPLGKVNRQVLELWVKVLHTVNDSRLVLHAPPGSQRVAIRSLFGEGGIAPARIGFVARAPHLDHLRRYHDLDLSLDPFPYNGHTSTLDSLWMGVPVVTLAGRTAVGRGGASILSNLGLPELIAQTLEQYVAIAATMAADRARLAELRAGLRGRMRASPLMDGGQFAADVEAALRWMWRRWCSRGE
jgi:predicted O-linked N-acetylglucosamine transferase (SPINDLY family)